MDVQLTYIEISNAQTDLGLRSLEYFVKKLISCPHFQKSLKRGNV